MARRPYRSGSLTERRPGVWLLRYDAPPDPVTGARRRRGAIVHGPKKMAQARLTQLLQTNGAVTEPATITVADLIGRVMATATLERLTRADWEWVVERLIVPHVGGVPLAKLTGERIDRLYSDLRAAGVSPWRILRVHEILSVVCARAVKWRWLPTSPVKDAQRPRRPPRKARAHRDELVQAVADAASRHPVWGLCFQLASVTGARRGELAALTWADVDLDGGTVSIDKAAIVPPRLGVVIKATKTTEHRIVPLDADTVDILRDRRRQHLELLLSMGARYSARRFVFTHRASPLGDRPVRPDAITHWFTRLRNDVGAHAIRFGDLRHLAASEMLAAGVEVQTVAEILGNKPETLLTNYAHVLDGRKRAAIDAMGAVVRARRSS